VYHTSDSCNLFEVAREEIPFTQGYTTFALGYMLDALYRGHSNRLAGLVVKMKNRRESQRDGMNELKVLKQFISSLQDSNRDSVST